MQQHLFTSSSLHPASRNNSVPAGNNYTQDVGLVWAECNNNNPLLGSSASGVRSLGPELDSGGLERGSPSRPGAQCCAPQPAAKLQDTPANRKLQGKAKVHFRSDILDIFMIIVYCLL